MKKHILAAIFAGLCGLNLSLANHTPMSDAELNALILRAFTIKQELSGLGHNVEDRNTECLDSDDFVEIDAIMREVNQRLGIEDTDWGCEGIETKKSRCNDITPLLNEFYAIKAKLNEELFNCELNYVEYSTYIQTKIGLETKYQPGHQACNLECFQKLSQRYNNQRKTSAALRKLLPSAKTNDEFSMESFREFSKRILSLIDEDY